MCGPHSSMTTTSLNLLFAAQIGVVYLNWGILTIWKSYILSQCDRWQQQIQIPVEGELWHWVSLLLLVCVAVCGLPALWSDSTTNTTCKGKTMFQRPASSICCQDTHDWCCHVLAQSVCFLLSPPISVLSRLTISKQGVGDTVSLLWPKK